MTGEHADNVHERFTQYQNSVNEKNNSKYWMISRKVQASSPDLNKFDNSWKNTLLVFDKLNRRMEKVINTLFYQD